MQIAECAYVAESQRRRRGAKNLGGKQSFPRVAKALREIRQLCDRTQEQMAEVMGLTFAGYRPYDRGERDLTQSQIERIARELGIPVSAITSRLWPEEVEIIETRYSHDLAEIERQVADLPPEQAARVLRGFRQSLEIAYGAEVVRRN